jgi:hypothetical protein
MGRARWGHFMVYCRHGLHCHSFSFFTVRGATLAHLWDITASGVHLVKAPCKIL